MRQNQPVIVVEAGTNKAGFVEQYKCNYAFDVASSIDNKDTN